MTRTDRPKRAKRKVFWLYDADENLLYIFRGDSLSDSPIRGFTYYQIGA